MDLDLKALVKSRIEQLGVKEASACFGVSAGTISNWSSGNTSPSIDAVQLVLKDIAVPSEPETPKAMWEGRKVAILLPTYRTQNPDTHFTLFANYVAYGPEKIAMPKPIKGTCIWEARNRMIHKAMGIESVKTFLQCDDDMILPFGNVAGMEEFYGGKLPPQSASFNAITRIMSHSSEYGIVGGLYCGRHDAGKAQCELGFMSDQENQKLHRGGYSGLIPMTWVGTGWIRIERWVIEKLKEAIDGGMFPECKPKSDQYWYGYFNPIKVGIGEDVSFGKRCADIGIKSYLDASLICGHVGERVYWPSNTRS